MGKHGTVGLSAKVNQEIVIELHSSIFGVNINDEHHGALVAHLWVELLVPGSEERCGDVEPLAVQTQLRKSVVLPSFSNFAHL